MRDQKNVGYLSKLGCRRDSAVRGVFVDMRRRTKLPQ